jgi:hypothetical protein
MIIALGVAINGYAICKTSSLFIFIKNAEAKRILYGVPCKAVTAAVHGYFRVFTHTRELNEYFCLSK